MENENLEMVVKEIQEKFYFLFRRGFYMKEYKHHPNYKNHWFVELASEDCIIRFENDMSEIFLFIAPVTLQRDWEQGSNPDLFDLRSLVFYLTEGREFIKDYFERTAETTKQLSILSQILDQYLDLIIPLFGKNYRNIYNKLADARRKAGDLYLRGGP